MLHLKLKGVKMLKQTARKKAGKALNDNDDDVVTETDKVNSDGKLLYQ